MNGCHWHITHAGPAHADPANPDANVTALWDKQEEVIIGLFALYTTSEVYNQVASDTVYPMVHDKYQHLETLYGQVGSMATFNAWVGLVKTKLQEGSPFCPQLQAMLEAGNMLVDNGMTFSDMQMCFILLDALPQSYSTVAGAILAQGAPAVLVPQDLINRFLNEESHLNGPLGTLSKVNPNKPTLNTNKGKQWQAQKPQQSSSSNSQGSSSEVTCYYCQQPGYKKPDCKKIKRDQENTHKGKEGQIKKQQQQQANVMAAALVAGCKALLNANINGSGRIQEVPEGPQICLYVLGNRSSNNTWLLDSGASSHSMYEHGDFDTYEFHNSDISIANGEIIKAVGKGSICFRTSYGKDLVLENVLHIPFTQDRILSIATLTKKGGLVKFDETSFSLKYNFEPVVDAFQAGGLYWLTVEHIQYILLTPPLHQPA